MNIRHTLSARRNLFGPVDHDQLRQDLQLKLKEIVEQDSRRWNFNFQAEMPLLGRFQWEKIPADCAASFYQESPEPTVDVHSLKTEEDGRVSNNDEHVVTNQENCLSVSNALRRPAEIAPVQRKRHFSTPAVKSNNARITDYFSKRRRSVGTKSIISPFQTNFNRETQCRTIR